MLLLSLVGSERVLVSLPNPIENFSKHGLGPMAGQETLCLLDQLHILEYVYCKYEDYKINSLEINYILMHNSTTIA